MECNTCHRVATVDENGYLVPHRVNGRRCDGSGRHVDFVTKPEGK